MKRKTFNLLLFFLVLMFVFFMAGAWQWADAQGRYDDQPDTDIDIVNELTAGGSDVTALGLSQALGDVDIAGCIITTQWGIIIFQRQGYTYDVFCLADRLDEAGKWADAAVMRCQHPDSAKIFGGRCLSVMNFEPDEQPEPNPEPPDWATSAEQAVVHAQQEEEHDDRLAAIEQRMDREATARRAYARKLEAEKEVERQRAGEALKAYKAATQNEQ